MANVGIKNSWSLRDFRDARGTMKFAGPFTNPKTGEIFNSLAFVPPTGSVTLVGFSANLGELSPAQIKRQVDDLQVVELESGNFKLCKRGSDTWETIDF